MNEVAEIEKRTLTIERTYEAPRELVWEAWTKPEHIANWWAPPGMVATVDKHEFREGGEWSFSLEMPDGNKFITEGTYTKIVAPELIETTADFKPMTEGVYLIVKLIEDGDKTDSIFKVVHPTEEYTKAQEEMGFYNGWGSVFENLSTYLPTIR